MTLEQLLQLVEERVLHRFYGKYAGVVRDVEDPLGIGRLKALVPAVLGEDVETGWALPCAPFGGGKDRGMLCMPEVGDTVWVEFAGGDVSQPIWSGAFWGAPDTGGQQDDLAQEAGAEVPTSEDAPAGPGLHVLRTKAGHRIALDDEGDIVVAHGQGKTEVRLNKDDEVLLKSEKAEIRLNKDQEVVLTSQNGSPLELRLDKDGAVQVKTEKATLKIAKDGAVTLECDKAINIKTKDSMVLEAKEVKLGDGASEPLVLGNQFMTLFNQHTHPTGVGPSGPPTPTMQSSSHLSNQSFAKRK